MRASLATTAATLALVVFAAPALAAGERGTSPPRRIAGLDPAAAPAAAAEASRAGAAGGAPTIDTSALAYYLQQNNQARAQAEIRRLRLLHPGWEPPADLASLADPSGDVQPLWQMYGAGRIDELRAEIARRIERGWQPPPELVAKLRLRETRRSLIEASDARAWATVIDLAARNPDLVTTEDLDLTWRVAEAAARTGDSRRAAELYRLILTNETRAPERLATVQKAGEVLSDADLEPLIALGNRRADGSGEFDDIRLDRLRRRIGVALGGGAVERPSETELAPLEAATRRRRSAGDAALIGWYRFGQQSFDAAERWFALALDVGTAPDAVVGRILALGRLGRREDARALAEARQGDDDTIAALFVDLLAGDITARPPIAPAPARLAALGDTVRRLRSANGAQALGWYGYGTGRFDEAAAWFDLAMTWKPDATTARGHLLAAARGTDKGLRRTLEQRYAASFPEAVRDAGKGGAETAKGASAPRREAGFDRAIAAHKAKNAALCLAELADIRRAAPLGQPARMLEGWCLLDADRPAEAAGAFAALAAQPGKAGEEAAYGLALARLRTGEPARAAEAAAALGADRRKEIDAAVLAQQASAAFDRGDYAATLDSLDRRSRLVTPSRDLEVLGAWALLKAGRTREAMALFGRLDREQSTRDTRIGFAEASKLTYMPRER